MKRSIEDIRKDGRFSIAREHSGRPDKPWAVRFNGEWIGSAPTEAAAEQLALEWERDRWS